MLDLKEQIFDRQNIFLTDCDIFIHYSVKVSFNNEKESGEFPIFLISRGSVH